jgi:exopolysaccharide biosynthesis polyprenyl glycosylphosphotransferase
MMLSYRPDVEFLRQKVWHRALAAVFDFLSVFIAWWATMALRMALNPVMARHLTRASLAQHAPSAFVVLLLWAGVATWLRLYAAGQGSRPGRQLRLLTHAAGLLNAFLIAYAFFSRQIGSDDISRSFVLLFAPMSLALLLSANYAVLAASIRISRRLELQERFAVAGDGPEAEYVAEHLTSSGAPGRFVGFILPTQSMSVSSRFSPVLGTTATVAEVINRARLDRIIVANGSLRPEEASDCLRVARRMGVITAHALAGVCDSDGSEPCLRLGSGLAMVEVRPRPFHRKHDVTKRIVDVCLSAALLILVLPLLVILAVLIKITSPGPLLFISERVGRGGRHFTFLKFRTMFAGADAYREQAGVNEQNGHLFKIRFDPRVTRVGRFMRRYSLDELPQLVNVLMGDMSLVGPRPLPARDLDPDGCSRTFAVWARQRAEVTPGVTCLWQIRGRSDLPFEKMMELDLEYIRNWSPALDLEILLETPLAVLSGRGAY